jgi:hypothetical protein
VSWSGADDAGGSGVDFFDVFFSDDGGPLELFRAQTADTSAEFTGESGHTYDFFIAATDNVGNREEIPSLPQPSTTVGDSTPPVMSDVPGDQVIEGTILDGALFSYALPSATDDQDPDPTVSCDPPSDARFPFGTTTVTCTATDDSGNASFATFAVTVQDTIGLTVQRIETIVERRGISRIVLTFSEALDPASAKRAANYALRSMGRDKLNGTADDRVFTLGAPKCDSPCTIVSLTRVAGPRLFLRPLPLDQFFHLEVFASAAGAGITDLANNQLQATADNPAGENFNVNIARGHRIVFPDGDGDRVTLTLMQRGTLQIQSDNDGRVQELRLIDTIATRGVLTGSVVRSATGDGKVRVPAVSGDPVAQNGLLRNPAFVFGPIAADLVDHLLESRGQIRAADNRTARELGRLLPLTGRWGPL